MKKQLSSFLIIGIILLFSCQPENKEPGDFKILPLPQELAISGISELDYDDIQLYYSPNDTPFPITNKSLQVLEPRGLEER